MNIKTYEIEFVFIKFYCIKQIYVILIEVKNIFYIQYMDILPI